MSILKIIDFLNDFILSINKIFKYFKDKNLQNLQNILNLFKNVSLLKLWHIKFFQKLMKIFKQISCNLKNLQGAAGITYFLRNLLKFLNIYINSTIYKFFKSNEISKNPNLIVSQIYKIFFKSFSNFLQFQKL